MPIPEIYSYYQSKALEGSKCFYVAHINMLGAYAYVNDHFSNRFLAKGENIIGKPFSTAIYIDDVPLAEEIAYQCLAEPGISKKVIIRKPVGKDVLLTYWEFTCVLDSTAKPDGVICIGYDVTESERTQLMAKEYLQQMNEYLEGVTDGFFTLNKKGEFTRVNTVFEDIIGLTKEELIGLHYQLPQTELSTHIFTDAISTAVAENRTIRFEHAWANSNNHYHVSIFSTKSGCICYMKNINERKKSEIKIKQQYEQLKDIAFMQSHELRAPLTNIMGIVNAVRLLEKDNHDPEIKALLDALHSNAHKMDETIRKIVAVTNQPA